MESNEQMQSLPSRRRREDRFEAREGFPSCMRKTQEQVLPMIRDLPHVSRLRLRDAIALQYGPANHLER